MSPVALPPLHPSVEPVRRRDHEAPSVRLDLDAYCWSCNHRHRLGRTPQDFTAEVWEWEAKHRGHDFEFLSPRRRFPPHFDDRLYEQAGVAPWWVEVQENANVKLSYAASAPLTITLASLAASTTFLSGRESTAINNTANLYIDGRITVKIRTGTTPTVDTEIRVYGYAGLDDTPAYPDTITGTDNARSLTNAYILDAGLVLLGATAVSATSNVDYFIRCLTVAEAFGFVPTRFGVYVAHNTVAALNATGGTHVLTYMGAYLTSI